LIDKEFHARDNRTVGPTKPVDLPYHYHYYYHHHHHHHHHHRDFLYI